jgi:hypothetical protein
VGEAEEVERFGLAVWRRPTMTMRAEVNEARFVRVQRKAESAEPLSQHVHDPPSVMVGLKGHHEVVSEPYQGRLPPHAWSHLVLEPFVQHVVQENVREHRRDDAALRGSFSREVQVSFFQDTRIQPFVDHPPDNTVRDSLVKDFTKV